MIYDVQNLNTDDILKKIKEYVEHEKIGSPKLILKEIDEREKMGSTFIGDEMAFPHVLSTSIKKNCLVIFNNSLRTDYYSNGISKLLLLCVNPDNQEPDVSTDINNLMQHITEKISTKEELIKILR